MLLLWISIFLGLGLANAAQFVPAGRVALPRSILDPAALCLLVAGLAVRWTAILTLGKWFTVDVAVHDEHQVVQTGLYRFMRHPSYTGLLIAFLGMAVYSASWLSLLALLVPILLAVLYRVAREEEALLESLGPAYGDYCARTKRFIPGVL